MQITTLNIADITELAPVFNALCSHIPYCHPITPAEFKTGLYFPAYVENMIESEKIFVAEHNNQKIGFSHIALETDQETNEKRGVFRFFIFHPAYRQAGQMLLEESEKYLRKKNASCVSTPKKSYRFWSTRAQFSGQLLQVPALFQENEYRVTLNHYAMACPGFHVSKPQCPRSDIELIHHQEETPATRPSYVIEMQQQGRKVGQCYFSSLGHYYQAPEAQNCFYINDIYLEPTARGKGLGRYLLEQSMWEMQQLGYTDGALATDCDNHRAQRLYLSCGYHVIDTIHHIYKSF